MNPLRKETVCLVFRTNLQDAGDVEGIAKTMNGIPGVMEWSVDLEDWEKVLRVAGIGIRKETILNTLKKLHIDIRELPL